MKKFVIERNIPGSSTLSIPELQANSKTFCEALDKPGQPYTWVYSYVSGDKIYSIHIAENEEVIRQYSMSVRFPVNIISEGRAIIDAAASHPLQVA